MPEPRIRHGVTTDIEAVNTIYNHYVLHTPITFDIDPWSLERRKEWYRGFDTTGRHQIFVAEDAGKVIGFAYSGPFGVRAAYDTSIETTVYLAEGSQGRGIGRALYEALFESLRTEDVHCACAGITLPNPASIALHRALGFEPVGIFHEVGRKFDTYWDVQWFEKRLGCPSAICAYPQGWINLFSWMEPEYEYVTRHEFHPASLVRRGYPVAREVCEQPRGIAQSA